MTLVPNDEQNDDSDRVAGRLSDSGRLLKQNGPIPPARATDDPPLQSVAALEKAVEELQNRNDDLKTERDRLREENRSLRKEVTHLRLLHELEDSIDAIEAETGGLPAAPPPAEHLYTLLPPSFSFPVFFEIADSRELGTDEARRCLLHFLAKDLIVQKGSRLVKTQKTIEEADGSRSE